MNALQCRESEGDHGPISISDLFGLNPKEHRPPTQSGRSKDNRASTPGRSGNPSKPLCGGTSASNQSVGMIVATRPPPGGHVVVPLLGSRYRRECNWNLNL